MTVLRQRRTVAQISCVVGQSEHIHLVPRRDSLYLMESTNFIALVRWIRDAVAKVKNSHNFPKYW
jgi:hypothetical protein